MSPSKFSRRRRVQQPPATCKRPTIPEPPGTPIDTLHALISWTGEDLDGNPINLNRTCTLTRDPPTEGDHFSGYSYPQPSDFLLRLDRNSTQGPFTATLWLIENNLHADTVAELADPNQRFPIPLGPIPFPSGSRKSTCICALITT